MEQFLRTPFVNILPRVNQGYIHSYGLPQLLENVTSSDGIDAGANNLVL